MHKLAHNFVHHLTHKLPNFNPTHTSPFRGVCGVWCVGGSESSHVR